MHGNKNHIALNSNDLIAKIHAISDIWDSTVSSAHRVWRLDTISQHKHKAC